MCIHTTWWSRNCKNLSSKFAVVFPLFGILSYHHYGFMATHALGHMMHSYTLLVPINQSAQQAKQGA